MAKKTIKAACPSCGATGLYQGFMEGKDEAVVCVTCEGTGCQIIQYVPFERRRRRNSVKKIRFGSGLIVDNPQAATWMSYKEFREAIPPGEKNG